MRRSADRQFPMRGDVWVVDLEPAVGSEIGRRRPALVVSNDASNRYSATVTVLPITSAPAKRAYLDEVVVQAGEAGLTENPNRIKANMVRTVDKSRLVRFVGALGATHLADVDRALRVHLDMLE